MARLDHLQSQPTYRRPFTDISMPGTLNGFDLARRVQVLYPQIAVLVTSGALPSGFSGEAPQARFVPKPYCMSTVIQIIRGMSAQSVLCLLEVGMHASWYLSTAQ